VAAQIEHTGVVQSIAQGRVCVRIASQSACASCEARRICGLDESREKTVEVATPDWASFHPGDVVTVSIDRRTGAVAVLAGYVGALAVLLASLAGALGIGSLSEGCAVLVSLGSVVVYYGVLYVLRKPLESKIHFKIHKS